MKFNKEIASKMKMEYNARKGKATELFNYYIGRSKSVREYPKTDRSNRIVSDNFIKCFTDEEVSFMVGLPVNYVDKTNRESLAYIENVLNGVSATIDVELATNMLIYSTAYEFYYKNNDEFNIKVLSPMEGYGYLDSNGNVQLFMYFFKKELDNNDYILFVDDEYIYEMDSDFNILKNRNGEELKKPHYFNFCPVGVAKLPNGIYDTLGYNLGSLQDAYNYVNSDWGNEIGDTRLAYLALYGLSLDDEDAAKMKEKGILQIPDAKGKAEWLIKNIDPKFVKEYRDAIKEDIYRVAQHIDNQENVQSNTSGSMLSTRLNCLRLKIMTPNSALKNCIKMRLRCLFRFLDVEKNKNFNYKDVEIRPQINLPKNDVETAQIISQLPEGILSKQTARSLFSFMYNPSREQQLIDEEMKKEMDNEILDIHAKEQDG